MVLEVMSQGEGVTTKSDHYDGVPHYFGLFQGIKGVKEFLANVVGCTAGHDWTSYQI